MGNCITLDVNYFIPKGTYFYPYVSSVSQAGAGRKTTVEINFAEEDLIDTLHMDDPESGAFNTYYQLSLGKNESKFDSYIVAVDDVLEQ